LYYLYERSPKGFWIYQGLRVLKSRQDFEDYDFIDEFGTVYTTISVAYNALEKEIALTISDGKKKDMIILSTLRATNAFLGLSFLAFTVINNTEVEMRFQAVKLKDYRPLPFIIGDRVALVQNDGMSANVGAEAIVKRVDLWQPSYQDPDSPKGLVTNLEVEWQDSKQNKQTNGGYPIQVFKNLSRPQAINSVPNAQTEKQINEPKVWRVKTEAEFLAEFGIDWRKVVNWTINNDKDFLFGKPLIDIVQDTDIARIPKTDASYLGSAGSRSDALYTKIGLDRTDKSRQFGLDADDVTDAPLPKATSTPSSIDIVDLMKFTSWSSGLQQSMIQDFVQSGYKFLDKLIGDTKEETSKNIQKKVNGFSSGKNTYLQANMLAEIIPSFVQKQNTVNVQPTGIVWRVKTEAEYKAEYGKDWKEVVSWFDDGTKEWLFGRDLLEVIDEDSLVNVPKTKAELIGMGTVYTLASVSPNGDVQGLDEFDLTDAPLPNVSTQTNKPFDVMRKEAYKFRASTPEESWAFQEYVFSKGVKRLKNLSQNINDTESDFMVENGILLTLSLYSFNSSTVEEVSLSTLGIKVEDYPKPAPVKKATKKPPTPKVQATATVKKPDVQNLYNELDDLDI
jgi:hypothetical protein